VHGQLLADLEIPLVVDIELLAAGERRPRGLLFMEPAELVHRLAVVEVAHHAAEPHGQLDPGDFLDLHHAVLDRLLPWLLTEVGVAGDTRVQS